MVDGSAVVIAVLTSTSDSPLNVGWMPRSNTGDLAQTLVRLPWKLLRTPSASDTLKAVTFRDRNAVNHLVLLKDGADLDRLLEKTLTKLDFVRNTATIDLYLHEMCFLLLERSLANLGMGEDADDRAVLLDALELTFDGLSSVFRVLLGVLCEGLLLRFVPVLVEPTLDLVAQMFGPDSSKRAETTRSFDIANETDNNHLNHHVSIWGRSLVESDTNRRGFYHSDSFDDFLLVHFGAWTVEVADNGGHAGLVAHRCRKVYRFFRIVLGE